MDLTRFFLGVLAIKGVVFPNVTVASVDISLKSISEASEILSQTVKKPENIIINYDEDQVFTINSDDIDLEYDFLDSSQRAYNFFRTGNFLEDLVNKMGALKGGKDFGLVVKYNSENLDSIISILAGQIDNEPKYPSIEISGSNVIVENGSPGRLLDKDSLMPKINHKLAYANNNSIELPTKSIDPTLTENQIKEAKERAQALIGKNLIFKLEHETLAKKDREIIKLIDPSGGYNENQIQKLIEEVSLKFDRDPQEPKFEFLNGKVAEFQAALDGIKTDKKALADIIESSLTSENLTIDVPVAKTPPQVSTDKINNYGIKELIGRGTSSYFHSIPGRVHNVNLAATKINGNLIAPGETFSFNEALGDVSKFTGYKSAYVILGGKTVLGDGGGVCQVSSTLFRAVLNAGLPIDQRSAHAYRVGYYEQGSPPGFDATVYAPSPDFKFTNNTDNYILITAKADSKNYSLVFELYGTNDGRVSDITKPVITNQSAPGPDIYQDDPSLPIGTTRQVEYKAYGARVSFDYKVTRGGEEIYKKTFVSNYRPWQAVYLKGTKI